MPRDALSRFYSENVPPAEKWKLIEPFWPAVKNTGYARAARIAMHELYGVEELSAGTVEKVREGYELQRKKGFYRHILCDLAGIESCQVNCLGEPFKESQSPTLLMQDLSIVGMFAGPDLEGFGQPAGIQASNLADWHRVIDWWFDKYSRYAVAVKSQHAYSRDIDYRQVPAEKVEKIFKKRPPANRFPMRNGRPSKTICSGRPCKKPPRANCRSNSIPATMRAKTRCPFPA